MKVVLPSIIILTILLSFTILDKTDAYEPPTSPTYSPTKALTESPTKASTDASNKAPTEAPTDAPTEALTGAPTNSKIEAPTAPPTKSQVKNPSVPQTTTPTSLNIEECKDNNGRFEVPGFIQRWKKSCLWVGKDPSVRCEYPTAVLNCPLTCEMCSSSPACVDSTIRFYGPDTTFLPEQPKRCVWVDRKLTSERCKMQNTALFCPVTCGICDKTIQPYSFKTKELSRDLSFGFSSNVSVGDYLVDSVSMVPGWDSPAITDLELTSASRMSLSFDFYLDDKTICADTNFYLRLRLIEDPGKDDSPSSIAVTPLVGPFSGTKAIYIKDFDISDTIVNKAKKGYAYVFDIVTSKDTMSASCYGAGAFVKSSITTNFASYSTFSIPTPSPKGSEDPTLAPTVNHIASYSFEWQEPVDGSTYFESPFTAIYIDGFWINSIQLIPGVGSPPINKMDGLDDESELHVSFSTTLIDDSVCFDTDLYIRLRLISNMADMSSLVATSPLIGPITTTETKYDKVYGMSDVIVSEAKDGYAYLVDLVTSGSQTAFPCSGKIWEINHFILSTNYANYDWTPETEAPVISTLTPSLSPTVSFDRYNFQWESRLNMVNFHPPYGKLVGDLWVNSLPLIPGRTSPAIVYLEELDSTSQLELSFSYQIINDVCTNMDLYIRIRLMTGQYDNDSLVAVTPLVGPISTEEMTYNSVFSYSDSIVSEVKQGYAYILDLVTIEGDDGIPSCAGTTWTMNLFSLSANYAYHDGAVPTTAPLPAQPTVAPTYDDFTPYDFEWPPYIADSTDFTAANEVYVSNDYWVTSLRMKMSDVSPGFRKVDELDDASKLEMSFSCESMDDVCMNAKLYIRIRLMENQYAFQSTVAISAPIGPLSTIRVEYNNTYGINDAIVSEAKKGYAYIIDIITPKEEGVIPCSGTRWNINNFKLKANYAYYDRIPDYGVQRKLWGFTSFFKSVVNIPSKLGTWTIESIADVEAFVENPSLDGALKLGLRFVQAPTPLSVLGPEVLGSSFDVFSNYGKNVAQDLALEVTKKVGLDLFAGEVGDKCDYNPFLCMANNFVCDSGVSKRCFRIDPRQIIEDKVCVRDVVRLKDVLEDVISIADISTVMHTIKKIITQKVDNRARNWMQKVFKVKDEIICDNTDTATVYFTFKIISLTQPLRGFDEVGVYISEDGTSGVFIPGCAHKIPFGDLLGFAMPGFDALEMTLDFFNAAIGPFLGDIINIAIPNFPDIGLDEWFKLKINTPTFPSISGVDVTTAFIGGVRFGFLFGDSSQLRDKTSWAIDYKFPGKPIFFSYGFTETKTEFVELAVGAFKPLISPIRECSNKIIGNTLSEAETKIGRNLYRRPINDDSHPITYTKNDNGGWKNFKVFKARRKLQSGSFVFEANVIRNAQLALGSVDDTHTVGSSTISNHYQVIIGGWNNRHSLIRDYINGARISTTEAFNMKVLELGTFRKFRISWDLKYITVERYLNSKWERLMRGDRLKGKTIDINRVMIKTYGSQGFWRLIDSESTLEKEDIEKGRIAKIDVGSSNSKSKVIYLDRKNLIINPSPTNDENPSVRDGFMFRLDGRRLTVTNINDNDDGWGMDMKLEAFSANIHIINVGKSTLRYKSVKLPYHFLTVDPPAGFVARIKGIYLTMYSLTGQGWTQDLKVEAYYNDVRFNFRAIYSGETVSFSVPQLEYLKMDRVQQQSEVHNPYEWTFDRSGANLVVSKLGGSYRRPPTWYQDSKFRATYSTYYIVNLGKNIDGNIIELHPIYGHALTTHYWQKNI